MAFLNGNDLLDMPGPGAKDRDSIRKKNGLYEAMRNKDDRLAGSSK
jgi:hypothetical protein